MTYFLDLFSPATFEAFSNSDRSVSGFRPGQRTAAERVQVGDKLLCYVTKLGGWCGLLEVTSPWYSDDTPRFYLEDDPFTVRFKVNPLIWLPKESAFPIRDDRLWTQLSFTRGHDKGSSTWTGRLRASLARLEDSDGEVIEECLRSQVASNEQFPIDERQYAKSVVHQVRAPSGPVLVTVPEDDDGGAESVVDTAPPHEVRESIKIQAMLARIGAEMGMSIWIPRSDRARVVQELGNSQAPIIDVLPLNYEPQTLRTIEQIDVLWIKNRWIARAFEVEHTTSIYSGLLRMADLMALQPQLDIRLHIVAPAARREKVKDEIRRPVFALLDRGPLSDSCTYISYESVEEIAAERHLAHLSDRVLDEYAEEATE